MARDRERSGEGSAVRLPGIVLEDTSTEERKIDLEMARQVNEKAGPQWTVPGHGIIDYRAHFRLLRRFGYDGPVSLEPHMDGSQETTEECLRAVEALLKERVCPLIDGI